MTANRPQPRPGVLDIAPYVPGKSAAPGVAKVFKLSSNETPLGPSPNAIAAYRAVGEHLEDYPDGSASTLHDGHRRKGGRRSGNEIYGQRGRDSQGGNTKDENHLPRESEQPDRDLSAV